MILGQDIDIKRPDTSLFMYKISEKQYNIIFDTIAYSSYLDKVTDKNIRIIIETVADFLEHEKVSNIVKCCLAIKFGKYNENEPGWTNDTLTIYFKSIFFALKKKEQ